MIPADGHFGMYQTPGRRFAVGVSAGTWAALTFTVAEDELLTDAQMSPLAVLDVDEVAQLRDDLTSWLKQHA